MSDRLRIPEREGRMGTVRSQGRQEAMASRQEQGYSPSTVIDRKRLVRADRCWQGEKGEKKQYVKGEAVCPSVPHWKEDGDVDFRDREG